MGIRAVVNPIFIVDQDASISFESPKAVDLELPLSSLAYQFKWDAGVKGEVVFFASIFPAPYNWETLESCGAVRFALSDSQTDSMIVSIPGLWLNAGFIKFVFTPVGTSSGNMNVASRTVPI